jgi:2',3'-cyclic-nucleotide 2'-phosphodiesterase (5'-nucleotidase family)
LTPVSELADKFRAQAILKGYERIGCHAVNVGGFDLAAGTAYLQQIVDSTEIPFISANIIDSNSGALLFPPHHIITEGGLTIGVIGLTNLIPAQVRDVKINDFIKAGEAQIAELKPQVDIIVVLANVNRDKNKLMNEAFTDADYIFLSRNTVRTRPGTKQPLNGPFTYGSNIQGKYLAQVDLHISTLDSPLVDVTNLQAQLDNIDRRLKRFQDKDPNKSLDKIYADQPRILKMIDEFNGNRKTMENGLQTAQNTSGYTSVALSRKIGDDNEILAYVTDILGQCEALKKYKVQKNIFPNPPGFEERIKKGMKSG